MMLSIVIVSFNSYETIKRCLNDLLGNPPCQIIIVDNASRDDTVKQLQENYPKVELVSLKQNLGYGRAANVGFEKVNATYSLLLNPDMELTLKDFDLLSQSVQRLDGSFTILGPAVMEKQHTNTGIKEVDWVHGSAMIFNMSKMAEVGFFDDAFFLFYEETELCYRAKSKGHKLLLDSNLYIRHLSGQSSTYNRKIEHLKDWHFGWSRCYFYNKHPTYPKAKGTIKVLLRYFLKSIVASSHEKRTSNRFKALGSLAFLKGESAFNLDGSGKRTDRL
jgi:GT2 family glycosyltransferase